jgi:hypothetical protein
MDIDKLKETWKMSAVANSGDDLLDEVKLKHIMRKRYNALFFRIALMELLVAAGYLFLMFFLIVFFHFFQKLWLQIFGITAIVLLLIIPTLSLRAFFRYYRSGKPTQAVGDTLAEVRRSGQVFMKTQYMLLALNILLVADLVVLVPLVYSENLSFVQMMISISVLIGIVCVVSLLLWRYYKKRIKKINEFASHCM